MTNLTTANTAKELFSALNAIRIENNKPAYKSCKESKAIMLEKITTEKLLALMTTPAENILEVLETINETPEVLEPIIETIIETIETPETPDAIIETPETPIETPDTFSVADLARDLDIDPKVARRKLRKIESLPERVNGKKWEFACKFKSEIEAIIK